MNKSKLAVILLTIGIYFIATIVSYLVFSQIVIAGSKKTSVTSPTAVTKSPDGKIAFDLSLPKTEVCPLNGTMYSKQQKQWWEKHRPLGVMIENHEDARPQSGLSFADVIYEVVAEGGITRFLAVYYCQDAGTIGPVRSARTYFLDFISEYGDFPLYTHVGGANTPGPANALSQIEDYGWGTYNDLNQFSIGFPTFWRDYDRLGRTVATEHTMYSTTSKLWDFAKTRKLTNADKDGKLWDDKFTPYSFKDDAVQSDRGISQTINLEFWNGYSKYFVNWVYNPVANSYNRINGGLPHSDKNTNKQLAVKNIVVLSMVESNANDGYENNLHLLYKTKGTGKAYIFMDGKQIVGTWKKSGRIGRTLIYDAQGAGVKFDRGTIWFDILPTTGVISVK